MFKNFGDKKFKIAAFYSLGVIVVVLILNYMVVSMKTEQITYNKFLDLLSQKKISEVQVTQDRLTIIPKDNSGISKKILYTGRITDVDLKNELKASGADITAPSSNDDPLINFLITYVFPIGILLIVGKFLFGRIDKKLGSGVMSFGKNNAKVYAESETGVTFLDVAGQDEAKESLMEIVDFLHNQDKYIKIGARLPKGALLVGPPGTGKTLLAKAVAGEAKVPFFSMSGSNFVEMFVGMGASRVRDLFQQAQQKAPCIIFIDEIDAIGKSRDSSGMGGGNDEREQTLNQLLSEMDGFDSSVGVVILAATNRPEVLDKALLRPGRFDRRVIVDRPDLKGRENILKVHCRGVKLGADIALEKIAKATSGAVGSDLANMINEAALFAVKNGREEICQGDLEEAVEVVIAGKEKKDKILSDSEKKSVAFHEVGHAIVAALLKHTDPVHKITIVPRTMGALGYTMQLPEEEKNLVTREQMIDEITVLLGGRSAEEVEFNSISTGASNDIERATKMARNMVTIYGMTEKFDMMALESVESRYLDGRPVRTCSAETATLIDGETLSIIRTAHEKARTILTNNHQLLMKIAGILVEKETIMGDEFMEIVKESSAWKEKIEA